MTYDNICKYLAEEYPENFARWLLPNQATEVEVLKTELSLEPIRADSVTLVQSSNQILHLEFQTLPVLEPPLPLRMLDYWLRLYRQYRCPIEQVIIFLKSTTSQAAFINEFTAANTWHRYRVIRLWEQDPAPFLADNALLPLATLTRAETPRTLLEQVAAQVARIESAQQRQNLAASVEILAGLRFEQNLINQLFREDIMKESVIYQQILQEGVRQGQQLGESTLVIRQLERRFGSIDATTLEQIRSLTSDRLEQLAVALLDFVAITDVTTWLQSEN
ncbi:DUF4351 domain-containing protein [Synechocystis sp. PCC 7509]|uniref:DUF4351 domain-containing protein n=1 Tax=Synechocystis sp. PCC 7509 TaxID=927677 RepID=UPI0002ACD6AF|nr:DUF4351 domain-containing protein [Synechocystis sp. PCC 7509]